MTGHPWRVPSSLRQAPLLSSRVAWSLTGCEAYQRLQRWPWRSVAAMNTLSLGVSPAKGEGKHWAFGQPEARADTRLFTELGLWEKTLGSPGGSHQTASKTPRLSAITVRPLVCDIKLGLCLCVTSSVR